MTLLRCSRAECREWVSVDGSKTDPKRLLCKQHTEQKERLAGSHNIEPDMFDAWTPPNWEYP